jgi:hypothetical protein
MSVRRLRFAALFALLAFTCSGFADTNARPIDSDQDGLSDLLEQRLLVQFAPKFMIGQSDCAGVPAQFRVGSAIPLVEQQDGTIYGQVFPFANSAGNRMVEVHFYHLWGKDCGPHGHRLDAEHVSVLVQASGSDLESADWKAIYWYAAAHEKTVCDVSQIARASTLRAEDSGAKVWISPGKHASYLSETLCASGCGADKCERMKASPDGPIINLGEARKPMNESLFIASAEWPLEAKMVDTNFPSASTARLNLLPDSDIAWANAGKHPVQGVIADSSLVGGAIAESGHNTTGAVSNAGESTGNALGTATRNTQRALGKSARNVGRALGIKPKDGPKDKLEEAKPQL